MRIIAGEARGRPIVAPEGRATRPTLDRVRESLFNILQQRIPDARVLDCFAGSGALALESLSRGAASAVLVDSAPKACQVIGRNLATLGMEDRARLLAMDWKQALRLLVREEARFDLIFLDPPYRMAGIPEVLDALRAVAAPGARFILEHGRALPPEIAPPLKCVDERNYGDTVIRFFAEEEMG